MMPPRCTICIPTWQAEAFIERTLDCAQSQTEQNIAIHVAVDLCADRTAELCEARAGSDSRIRVIRQTARQGWAKNCNTLIDAVSSPYFFFYFHDDLIQPNYVARLCALLDENPDAASAHSDVQHFGATSQLARSSAYGGPTIERLLQFVAAQEKSPLLRSVTRTAMLRQGEVHFEASPGNALGSHFNYVWRFLSLGPAMHAPDPLYRRWNQRVGGVTEGWRNLAFADVLAALCANADQLNRVVEKSDLTEADASIARYASGLMVLTRLRVAELERGVSDPTPPDQLAAYLSSPLPFEPLAAAAENVRGMTLSAFGQLRYLEADQCERRRDFVGAMHGFVASIIARPEFQRTWVRIANIAQKAVIDPLKAQALDRSRCDALSTMERLGHLQALGETQGCVG